MSKNRFAFLAKVLEITYAVLFFVFLFNALTVDFLVAPPTLALLRFPSNVRAIGAPLNAPWTQGLGVYHIFLLVLAVLGASNAIGLSHLKTHWGRKVCKASSFFGFFILWSIVLFFSLPFILSGVRLDHYYVRTAGIYATLAFFLLLVDIATFVVADVLEHDVVLAKLKKAQKK